jgi:Fur family ferric uptake transcriptional regulator
MAKESSWPQGLKRTKPRERVLDVLEGADKPMSAAQICKEAEEGGDSAWLSTIYRILELFVEKGAVTKLSVTGKETALYELNRFRHKHYGVCMGCKKIIPMANCPMERFMPDLEDEDFRVVGHNVEVYGYCGECGKLRDKGQADKWR